MSENRRELEDNMHLDLSKDTTYGDYLRLDDLLAAQRPLTGVHDEMLFIIQHHTSELWIKLLLHELDLAVQLVRSDRLVETFQIFARVGHVQRMLFEQWAVLETMTPSEYLQFRDALGKSSGFQSYQYRALEFVLGNKDANTLKPHQHDPRIHAELAARLAAPSLYDEFLRWLARRGYAVPKDARPPLRRVRYVREARRRRGAVPAVAVPAHDDGEAHHRVRPGHRRKLRRRLPQAGARADVLSGALGRPHAPGRAHAPLISAAARSPRCAPC